MAFLREIEVSRKALSEELLTRKLPKMIPLDDAEQDIKVRISRFLEKLPEENKLKNKVEKEKLLKEKLKGFGVTRILLDSPLVIPYPRSLLSEPAIYVWGEKSEGPKNIGEAAPHLRSTAETAEKQMGGRVYVSPDLRGNQDFLNNLRNAIVEIVRQKT
jgi:hypothetical protein